MGNGMIAQTKTNCFWFHLGPTLLSDCVRSDNCWSRDSPDGGEKNITWRQFTCVSDNAAQEMKCKKKVVCACVYSGGSVGRMSGLRLQSFLGAGGSRRHSL